MILHAELADESFLRHDEDAGEVFGEEFVDGVDVTDCESDTAHGFVASYGVLVDCAVDSQGGEVAVLSLTSESDPELSDWVCGIVGFVLFACVSWVDPSWVFEFVCGDDELTDWCAVV